MNKPLVTLIAILLGSVNSSIPGSPPLSLDLGDPQAVFRAIAPERAMPSIPESRMSLSGGPGARGLGTDGVFAHFSHAEIDLDVVAEMDSDLTYVGPSGGYEVLTNAKVTSAVYLRSTPIGGQAIFAIANEEALTQMTIGLPFDAGTKLVRAPGAEQTMLELEGGVVAVFAEPWAIDAAGAKLITSYQFDGKRLIQMVETDETTVFPVLADPAWTYGFKYDVGARTPASVKSTLHSCFNRKFPLSGAPAAFPATNQLVPLTLAGFGNFECRAGFETTVDEPTWVAYDFFFNATNNHIDYAGSSIARSFQFFPGDSTYSMLVSAYIVNDWGLLRGAYAAGAAASWALFADRLYISP